MSAHAATNDLTPSATRAEMRIGRVDGSEPSSSSPASPASPASRSSPPDAGWIRQILDEHGEPLLRYAARWLHGDTERAADVVQDAFVQLCRPDTKKPSPQHLRAWLYAVCRNRALDIIRKERRMTTFSPQHAGSDGADSADAAVASVMEQQHAADEGNSDRGTRAEHPEWSEQRSKVYQAMGALSETQQDVLRLKFQSGLSYAEIARVLDLSVTNVGFLIHTAIKALRQNLGPEPAVSPQQIAPASSSAHTYPPQGGE